MSDAILSEESAMQAFHSLAELEALPDAALEELWLGLGERAFYEAALGRALDDSFGGGAAVSDAQRLATVEACLRFYRGEHESQPDGAPRIPVSKGPDGEIRWYRVSDRILEHLRAGQPLRPAAKPASALPDRRVLLIAAIALALGCVLIGLARGLLKRGAAAEAEATLTAEALALLPATTPSPTPLALENIDRPIEAGEELSGDFPVLLELRPAAGLARVFPVQQRAVEVAEWRYERDPDVASALLGLVLRPVLGIPYSAGNAAYLGALAPGDRISLRLSTGKLLDYRVSRIERVAREEVSLFEQRRPGLALLLLADPAPDRLLVLADYEPGPERGELAATPAVDQALAGLLHARVTDIAFEDGVLHLPAGYSRLRVDVEITPLAAFDPAGLGLSLRLPGQSALWPEAGAALPEAFTPGEPERLSLRFLVPSEAASASLALSLGGEQRLLPLDLAAARPVEAGAQVQLQVLGAETRGEEVRLRLRFYNAGSEAVRITAQDLVFVLGPEAPGAELPLGPSLAPLGEALPVEIPAGEALDLELRYPWAGEPLAGLRFGALRLRITLR